MQKKPKAEAEEIARNLPATVGLADKAKALLEESFGGQQWRVAIARALAMKPDMMLFAEVRIRLILMDEGVVVEEGNPRETIAGPKEPRTQKLLSTVLWMGRRLPAPGGRAC